MDWAREKVHLMIRSTPQNWETCGSRITLRLFREGLIDKSKENATEIFPISSKSSKRTKENFFLTKLWMKSILFFNKMMSN